MEKMYYYRVLSPDFAKLLQSGGKLRWLFDFVKNHDGLDFQIGKNRTREWISVYYGLTRLITIKKFKNSNIFIDTAEAYQAISNNLYGRKAITDNFQHELEDLILKVSNTIRFNRYYLSKKEGYYQSSFSRRFGLLSKPDDQFVIIDKEAVVGYKNQAEKMLIFGSFQQPYKSLQRAISSIDSKKYGKDLSKKTIGNELDFLALDADGNLLLIEFKHGANCSGIYLSPLQIGLYLDIFSRLTKEQLDFAVLGMLSQKQEIGLINPEWKKPSTIKKLIPVLIIADYNKDSSAKIKFNDILRFIRSQKDDSFLIDLQKYVYTPDKPLVNW